MSPDQEATLFQTIGRIDERTRQTNETVEHLRSDIIDIYNENKEDRKNCETHRSEMNKRIDEHTEKKEEKAANQKQRIFENKHVRIGTVIGILGVCIGIAGFIF